VARTEAHYSLRKAALWDACEYRPAAEEEPCMDFDFFVMAQDFDIKDFKLRCRTTATRRG
jgi:hypothetical protein